ncbi:hypothetical protein FACS189440_04350 [Bacteroidia bacterium]|nr:hypothetical protein FACS189440_04350 [Bacteroidia bacterium]
MRTINVQISDVEYNAFGLSKDKFFFSEIAELIERQIARQALNRSVELAEKYNFSSISMEEISEEVHAVRRCKN